MTEKYHRIISLIIHVLIAECYRILATSCDDMVLPLVQFNSTGCLSPVCNTTKPIQIIPCIFYISILPLSDNQLVSKGIPQDGHELSILQYTTSSRYNFFSFPLMPIKGTCHLSNNSFYATYWVTHIDSRETVGAVSATEIINLFLGSHQYTAK